MPQMQFRRLLHDREVLSYLSKHILDEVYEQDLGGAGNRIEELNELLKVVDKTLFMQVLDSKSKPGKMSYD